MEPATKLIEKLQDYTINAIGRQIGYLISYRDNIEELRKQVEELKVKQISVQHLIDKARRNGEKIKDEVQHWMSEVDKITGQAQQFYEEESQAKTECSRTSCPNLWSRHQLSRRAKKMARDVVEILGKKPDKISYRDWILDSITSKSNEVFESRVLIMNQIIEALRDPSVNMIGLCGLGGVGKTAIAKEVAKKVKEEKMFDNVIMATVSKDPKHENVQGQIAYWLGMKLDENIESIRAFCLYERLKREKNLLLILDDLWEKLDLSEVGIPFIDVGKNDKNNEGCKILLTSRNKRLLADQMKCERNIEVGVLFEREALELFKGNAELLDDSSNQCLISIAEEVVQKCGGLPLAIVTAARALGKKDLTEYRDFLRRLNNPLLRNITGIKEVDSILKSSYDHLSPELQPIFLLSAMLSHDFLIGDLLMYSMGLGLLQGINNMEEAQDRIVTLVNELKAVKLLLDSFSRHHCTMHDVIRGVALSIASNDKHAFVVRHRKLNKWPDKNSLEGCTRSICLVNSEIINDLPEELHGPKLEFFLLNSEDCHLTIPSMFFKLTKQLKVLGFTNMHFSSLPSLGFLEELQTLCLHSCLLEDIAEVEYLKNLKILSLAHSKIKQLSWELAQLTCLQMLNLAHCSNLKVIPPKLLSSLKRLEVLYMENSFNQWDAEGSSKGNKNASLGELKDLPISSLDIEIPNASVLPKDLFLENSLERYKILIGEDWPWLSEYETSKTLKLKFESSIHLERGVKKLLERVEDLYLDGLKGFTNVLYDLDERGFLHLKHLQIHNNDEIEYVVFNSTRLQIAFPNLETLELHNLNGLKKLCQGQTMAASFQNLRVIKVRHCHQLESIFSISMFGFFSQLVEIDINGCESLKEIVIPNNEESFDEQNLVSNDIVFHQLRSLMMNNLSALTNFYFEEKAADDGCNKISNSLFSDKVSFPKLEILKLSFLNSLIPSIWDDRLPHSSLSNLKELIVEGCGFLVKLVPLHVLKSLSHLEELEVRGCELLEMVFDFEELNSYKETQSLQLVVPLKWLSLQRLPKLKHVWSNDPQGIVSFRSLWQVYAFDCKSLTSMFPPSIAKDMRHLERLQIENCGIEVIVAKDEVSESGAPTFEFPRLTSLRLKQLPNLRNFYPNRHTTEWSCLQELNIFNCGELKIFENEVSSSSAIQEEKILDLKYPLFFHEKVIDFQLPHSSFSSLKELIVKRCGSIVKLVPLHVLKSLSHLEKLEVWSCELLEMVFDFEELNSYNETQSLQLVVPLKRLKLWSLPKLKHVWSNDPQGIVSFRSLREVDASKCESLTSMFPTSIAKDMRHLEKLQLFVCGIEVIVAKDEVSESGAPTFEFPRLTSLRLEWLPNLRNFYPNRHTSEWPCLQELRMSSCDQLKIFENEVSSSLAIQEEEILDLKYPLFFHEKVSFLKLEILKLSFLKSLIPSIWDDRLPHSLFSNLKELIMERCGSLVKLVPLHVLKSLSHLEELEVRGCELLEMVFDFEGLNGNEETQSLQLVVPLKKLKLWELPKLKHVWSNDPQGIVCFQSLREVDAFDCGSLTSMFPASIAKGMLHLEKLNIRICGINVIVAKDEVSESGAPTFVFPMLTFLQLEFLQNLRNFYPNRHTSEWSSLQELKIRYCDQLKIFENEVSSSSAIQEEEILDSKYPLFFHEKVIPNLEVLELQGKQALMIWNGQFPACPFHRVKKLDLYLDDDDNAATFPYELLKRFPNLEELSVGGSIQKIFSCKEPLGDDA